MSQANEDWEYCQIEVRLLSNSRLHSKHTNSMPLTWFKFVAIIYSGDKKRVVGTSEKALFSNTQDSTHNLLPKKEQHNNYLMMLFSYLTNNGWEPIGQFGSQWWEHQFRRPMQERVSFIQKIKGKFLPHF